MQAFAQKKTLSKKSQLFGEFTSQNLYKYLQYYFFIIDINGQSVWTIYGYLEQKTMISRYNCDCIALQACILFNLHIEISLFMFYEHSNHARQVSG